MLHLGIKWKPLVILLALLVSGCATGPQTSSYQITIPTLTLTPKSHICWTRDRVTGQRDAVNCVTLLEEDYVAIVTELKAACLALGQDPEQCQAQSGEASVR